MRFHLLRVFAYFLFTLTVQSFASPTPSSMPAVGGNNDHHMSASVVKGIVIGIVVFISIPLLWCAYRMCHRTRQNSKPLYVTKPTPNRTQNSIIPSSSSYITRPHKAHIKVNAPTSRA